MPSLWTQDKGGGMMNKDCCEWKLDDWEEGELWNTECGEVEQFMNGTPDENKYKYCPYCGKPIKVVE